MTNVDFLIFGVLLLFGMLYAMLLDATLRGCQVHTSAKGEEINAKG